MFSNCSLYQTLFVTSVLTVYSAAANATEESAVNFSGFVNLGVTYSADDNLGFRSQLINEGRDGLSIAPDSVLGLQTNIELPRDFDFVAQVVLQDRTDNTLSNFIELAFLRYQINRNWAVKLGRFSTNSYLFTDFRYVGQASYWVRPPIEMYSTAGSLGNMDGAQIAYTLGTDFGSVKFSSAYGQSELNNDGDDGVFEISYQDLVVLNIEMQSDDWMLQGAYLSAILDDFNFAQIDAVRSAPSIAPEPLVPIFQQVADALIPDGDRVSYYSVSGKYYFDNIELTAEYGDYDSNWAFSPASQFGYVSLAYNYYDWMPFITLATYERDSEPEIINIASLQSRLSPDLFDFVREAVQPANDAAAGASVDQSSFSVGLRWDIGNNWAFKSQFDHFRISNQGSGLFTVEGGGVTNDGETSYNVTSLSLSTTF